MFHVHCRHTILEISVVSINFCFCSLTLLFFLYAFIPFFLHYSLQIFTFFFNKHSFHYSFFLLLFFNFKLLFTKKHFGAHYIRLKVVDFHLQLFIGGSYAKSFILVQRPWVCFCYSSFKFVVVHHSCILVIIGPSIT